MMSVLGVRSANKVEDLHIISEFTVQVGEVRA